MEQGQFDQIGAWLREYTALCILSSETEHYPLLTAIAERRAQLEVHLRAYGIPIRSERATSGEDV